MTVRSPRAVILVALVVAVSAAAFAVRASRSGSASLDEPFSLKSRFNSFANPEYFGTIKVRGRRIDMHIDSLRLSVYEPQVWNDLSVRAVLRAPDRSNADSSDYEELPTDSTTTTGADGTVLLREPWSMSLRVPRGASIADHRIVLEMMTPHGPETDRPSWNPAHLDSLLLRRAVSTGAAAERGVSATANSALSSPAPAQDVRTIGVVDGVPLYSGVSSIAFDPRKDLVFVADLVQNVVFVFDSTGGLVQRIGQQGKGPGDFQAPVGLTVSPDGTLWVRDLTRVQRFRWERVADFEGYRVTGQFNGPPMPDWNTRESSFLDSAGERYFYPNRSAAEPRESYQIYTREGGAAGTIVVPTFANLGPYTVWVRTSPGGGRMLYGMKAPPFAARPSWAITPDGTLLSTDGIAYEVAESDIGGRPVRTYRRDVPRVRIPAGLRSDSTLALRQRLDTISVPINQVLGLPDSVRLGLLPEYFPSIVDVLTSQSGARVVWRWTFGSGPERTEFDFFSPEGDFLGTGSSSAALARRPKPIIACDLLLGVREDADTGEQIVVRTRLNKCW